VTSPSALDDAVADVDALIGLDRLRCLHVNDAASALGSNLDRHASIGAGELGSKLGVFLAHPAFQRLPAILETPGPEGHGPDREEVRRLCELHVSGLRAARRRDSRRSAG
jgi:deoxyribonuclease-4